MERSEILREKQRIIDSYLKSSVGKFGRRRDRWIQSRTWNNASIMAISLYHEDIPIIERAYHCAGGKDIRAFIRAIKQLDETSLDANRIKQRFCIERENHVD